MAGMRWTLAAMAALCAWLAPPAMADAGRGVAFATQMFVERVETDLNGRTRRVLTNPARIVRGDRLIFIVNWRNRGERPMRDVALAIPGSVRVALDDPAMQVSVDGGNRWGRIGDLWLPTALGGIRRATAEDVTHVRWAMPDAVPPGRSGRLSYRGVVR